MSTRSTLRRCIAALVVSLSALVGLLTFGSGVAVAQSDDTVVTTSTLPTDNRELGNSLPKPNQGMEPQDPGDPGGWLQQSLFFLICAGVVVIALLVWRSSSRARQRRSAAGLDPVSIARSTGEGVRAPRRTVPVDESSDPT
jgi:hypothetical protein